MVCRPKDKGGLGVKDLDLFNLSLLGKWKWRLLTVPEAIWRKLLHFRYGDQLSTDPIRRVNHSKDSIWWSDLQKIESSFPSLQGWYDKAVRRKAFFFGQQLGGRLKMGNLQIFGMKSGL